MIDDIVNEGERLKRRLQVMANDDSASEVVRGLKTELSLLLDDVNSLIRNESVINPELKSQLEDKFQQARTLISDFSFQTRDVGRRVVDQTHQRMNDGLDASRAAVAESPLTALAVAAGVGMMVGMLVSNRR